MTKNGENQLDSFYYLGSNGTPISVMQMNGETARYYTFQKDMRGSTQAVIDNNGKCAEWYEYSDFGETTIHNENEDFMNQICYTGGVYDSSTELYYLNARYYDSGIGRFLTCDSYRGKAERTETLNLYVYCASNPISYVDPSGHFFDIAIDIVSIGWSVYDMINDPSFKNAACVAYDIGAAILPYVPGSKTYTVIDKSVDAMRITKKTAKTTKTTRRLGVRQAKKAYRNGTNGERGLEFMLKRSKLSPKRQKRYSYIYKGRKYTRIVDVYTEVDKIAHESKVGYTCLNKRIKSEIDKDVYLRRHDSSINEVTWHFYRSEKTGKIGASKALINYLRKNHINIVFHY